MNLPINRRRFLQTATVSLDYSTPGAHRLDVVNSKSGRVGPIGAGWHVFPGDEAAARLLRRSSRAPWMRTEV